MKPTPRVRLAVGAIGAALLAVALPATVSAAAPTVTITADRPPDSGGWYNHAVTFTASSSDPSLASCDPPFTYSAPDSATAAVTMHCTDTAGNVGSATATFQYDATQPVTTATLSPQTPDGANGWYLGPVTLTLSAFDATSGIATIRMNGGGGPSPFARTLADPGGGACIPDFETTYTDPVRVCGDGAHAIDYFAIDNAGNAEAKKTIRLKLDEHDPVTTATLSPPAHNGWYASPTLTLAADDGTGSGVAETDYSLDGGPQHVYSGPVGGLSSGSHVVRYHSTDVAGRVEAVQTLAFKVDAPPPTVNITTPADGAAIRQDKVVTAKFKCADNQSGMDTCVGTVPNGSNLDTSTVGAHTFTVTGTDKAGNATTVTHHYQVVYTWNGFFAPVTNTETSKLNLVHAGDLIKLAFALNGNRGLDVFAPRSPLSVAIVCPVWAPHTVPAGGAGTTAGLSYSVASGHYTYGWQTSTAWAGSCRRFELQLNDGSTTLHTADFMFFA